MLRKTLLAVTAIAALGTVALAPTSASAGGKFFKHGFYVHKHVGWGVYPAYPAYAWGPSCFYEKKFTPFGWKIVKVCSWY
jgi:hypothetical protein